MSLSVDRSLCFVCSMTLTFSPFSLENSNIGDRGAEKLADALVSLGLLEILKWVEHVVFSYLRNKRSHNSAFSSLMWFVLTSNILFSSLSQNCIGDQGMKKLATTLKDLPKLHCLRWETYTLQLQERL